MSEFGPIALVAAVVLGYGLVSGKLAGTWVTGPMIFVTLGVVVGPEALDIIDVTAESGALRAVAEATLVLLLFTDAVRMDVRRLRTGADLPTRLLGIGLPLCIGAGLGVAVIVLPELGLWEAALLAAVLAPTDAALGQAVVTSQRIPTRIRQTINVESGLNDGLMVPVITVFIALAGAEMGLAGPASWATFAVRQIGFGVALGVAVGYGGGWILDRAAGAGWVDGVFRQLATLAIGVGAFAGAEIVEGNGFVAAFVAGMAFGAAARDHCDGAYDFAEDEGHLLSMLTFLFFGAAMVGPYLDALDWRIAAYAVASLTVIRVGPAALSLVGAGLRPPTMAFIGWFGPRGIASILFVLLVVDEAALPHAETLLAVVTWTVLASVFAHGATAAPLARRFSDWIDRSDTPAEDEAMPEMPLRR